MLPENLSIAINRVCNARYDASIKAVASRLSEKYRNETGEGRVLLNNDNEALAYAISRMPATYEAIRRVVSTLTGEYASMLDVGAGTGSATWAINDAISIDRITCLEREQSMINLGKELMRDDERLSNVTWQKFDVLRDVLPHADIVVCAYMLGELKDEDRLVLARKLYDSADKTLVIVEPGTPKHFIQMMNVKEMLINNGARLVAPCPVDKCHKLHTDDWCHFTVRVQRSKVHKLMKDGNSPYEDEKYTYLIFSKTGSKCNSRVIRHPIIRPKAVDLELCTKDGIVKTTVTKSNPRYKEAKDLRVGDTFY